ncbi:MAG TPA: hypothetical protein ENH02_02485 [Bacteroidetes bacterium]|nr:hypothetical protein [Bacteroidota bacterium]
MLNLHFGQNKMNNRSFKYYSLMLLLLVLPFVLRGRQSNTFPKAEKLALFTDRDLYIAGEEVHFSAFVTNHPLPGLSHIVYAEILEPDGTRITGGKFLLAHEATHGCLTIPSGSITGTYYLRVYTKYMRNTGPGSFAYVSLRIINPYKIDVLSGNDTLQNKIEQKTVKGVGNPLKITTNKKIFIPREKVKVTVRTGKIKGLCASVVPELAAPGSMLHMNSRSSKVDIINFYPENRGLSVTGKLKDSITGKGEAGALVNLSIIGRGQTFMATKTDSSGHFYFSLPMYTGNRDLFLGPQNIRGTHPKILVDNDFSVARVHLPNPVFKLDSAERVLASQMAQNNRVRELFTNDSLNCNSRALRPDKAFYGKPSYTLTLDQYIQLPTLEEYFNELPSMVKVRKHDGKKYFKVIGDQPDMEYLEPLVLVDWVAVDDPEKILAASPSNVARIEVVNKPYVIGDITYGGIVSIITKKNNFAGIDLPKSGMFLNYAFLHDNCHCTILTPQSPDKPDTRNTLYWNPDLDLNLGNEVHFSFTTADTPGKYTIIFQGIGHDGKIFVKRAIIDVK